MQIQVDGAGIPARPGHPLPHPAPILLCLPGFSSASSTGYGLINQREQLVLSDSRPADAAAMLTVFSLCLRQRPLDQSAGSGN